MNTKQTLLNILLTIKKDGPTKKNLGICSAVANAMGKNIFIPDDDVEELLEYVMSSWPKAEGRVVHPVPGVDGRTRTTTFVYYRNNKLDMWDPETEYGRLRLELLDHCINHLQSDAVTN